MKGVADLGFNQADVCFVFCLRWRSREGREEIEAAEVHIAAHEGQLSKNVKKGREWERERRVGVVVLAQAVFLSARPYGAFLGALRIDWQSEWNINTPQPLWLPKELELERRQEGISIVSLPVRVCVCACGFVFSTFPTLYAQWRCWNPATTAPLSICSLHRWKRLAKGRHQLPEAPLV